LRLKILKKLRTASLNSEFTGSYKKSVFQIFFGETYCFNVTQEPTIVLIELIIEIILFE